MQQKKIVFVDASSLKLTTCWRKFYLNSIIGLVHNDSGKVEYKMAYGTAFHKFLKNLYSSQPIKQSIIEAEQYYAPFNELLPIDEWRTSSHLIQACRAYYNKFPSRELDELKPRTIVNDKNEVSYALEQTFCFPYWQNETHVIMLCGTIDMQGIYGGEDCIVDHKTTAERQDMFFLQYEFDIQTRFYSWVDNYLNRRGDKYRPILINGIFIKKATQKSIKVNEFDGMISERSKLIYFTIEQMQEFKLYLDTKLGQILNLLNHNNYESVNYNMGTCKEAFGSFCKYFQICRNSPSLRAGIIKDYYHVKPYEPLTFSKK